MSWILYIYSNKLIRAPFQMYKGKYVYIIREYKNELRAVQSVSYFLTNRIKGNYRIICGESLEDEFAFGLEAVLNYFMKKAKKYLYLRMAKRRMNKLRFELIEVAWHPDRLKWIL